MPKIRQLHKNVKIEVFQNLNKNNQQHFRNKHTRHKKLRITLLKYIASFNDGRHNDTGFVTHEVACSY